jgi:hypothetical protein
MKSTLSFRFYVDNQLIIQVRRVKFRMETDHNHTYKFCMTVYKSTIADMAAVQNVEVMSKKLNLDSICT